MNLAAQQDDLTTDDPLYTELYDVTDEAARVWCNGR